MTDTAIVGENVEVIQTSGPRTPFTWSVVIAGALAAWAVAFIFISLGSGIGLSVVSPYSGNNPDVGTMTIGGAIWLLFAETVAFTTAGYLAARLRVRDHIPGPETKFRDAAHGFMAWVVGVVLMGAALAFGGMFTAKTAADAAGLATGAAAGAATASTNRGPNNTVTAYYVDRMFRPGATGQAAQNNAPQQLGSATTGSGATGPQQGRITNEDRTEAARIMATSIRNGRISDQDRQYLAQEISARTGIPQQEAEQRVTDAQNQAIEVVKQATENARKAGAYLSFWSFMALLFGAVAATLAGILGGELRDDYARV